MKVKLAEMYRRNGASDDHMNKLFPIGSNLSSTKYNLMQKAEAHKSYKLKKEDLRDFRVPIQVCIDYSEVLRPTKLRLRKIVMSALGIATSHRGAKLSYEQFLKLNSFIRYNMGQDDDYIWFCVKLFDPLLGGFTKATECEAIIDLLFDNQDEEGVTTKPPKVDLPQRPGKKVEIKSQASYAGDVNAGE